MGERGRRHGILLLAVGAVVAALSAATSSPATAAGTPLRTLAEAKNLYFGSSLSTGHLGNSTYSNLVATQFDMATPENEMKWDTVQPSQNTFNFGPGDQIVSFAQSHNDRVRGHNLVWHQQLPGWVSSLPTNQVQAAMENHITQEVTHYKGKIYAWDVVNEPFNEDGSLHSDPFLTAMGTGYIADALRTAHAADPNAKLYLNDFNIEGTGTKSNAMFNLVQSLKQQGVPIDGVGFESHFILGQIPSSLQSNMARFAALGVDVAITELDVRMQLPADSSKLAQQANDFSTVVKACMAVSRCPGVTQWDVGDSDSWVPGTFSGQGAATMFDDSYNPKPAFTAVQTALGGGGNNGNTVTVTNPGNQTGTVGTPASLQIQASDSAAGQTLSYSATGLPAGLSINAGTGLISGTPTANGTSSVTVTVRDTTNASGSASFSWTIGPGGGGTGTCHVTYARSDEWAGGFVANLTVANTGTAAISGWTVTFAFPGDQHITNAWNASVNQSGANVTATNASYNAAIAPGGNVQFGFQGTWTSNDTSPSSFSVNGSACT
ncbi:MAG: endo-1,4-beta-xylanase [Mycobacteriales bacterium]